MYSEAKVLAMSAASWGEVLVAEMVMKSAWLAGSP